MGAITPTVPTATPARRPSWGLIGAVSLFGTGLACVVGIGVTSTAIASETPADRSARTAAELGLAPHTVYSDCDFDTLSDGIATVQCEGPTPTEIRLSGAAAEAVAEDPQANWSIPVEDYVQDSERGYAYFEIGSPYRTLG